MENIESSSCPMTMGPLVVEEGTGSRQETPQSTVLSLEPSTSALPAFSHLGVSLRMCGPVRIGCGGGGSVCRNAGGCRVTAEETLCAA